MTTVVSVTTVVTVVSVVSMVTVTVLVVVGHIQYLVMSETCRTVSRVRLFVCLSVCVTDWFLLCHHVHNYLLSLSAADDSVCKCRCVSK